MLKSLYVAFAMGIVLMFSACGGGEDDAPAQDNSTTVVHNGVSYKEVDSPFTQHIWLDRNLGASRVCVDLNDSECFGDYYQWGRAADGHQESNSSRSDTRLATSTTLSSDFIKGQSAPYDWTSESNASTRAQEWKKADGSSICPLGYRVPTIQEFENETKLASTAVTNTADAFNNFLKIPAAGLRNEGFGYLSGRGTVGTIWTTDISGTYSTNIRISQTEMSHFGNGRGNGYSVRCIKHLVDVSVPIFTSISDISVEEEQRTVIDVNVDDASSITYSISDGNSSYFRISSDSGNIYFRSNPDYETDPHEYTFKVTATDSFGNSASQTIVVTLLDIAEDLEVPIFTSSAVVSVEENNTTALTLMATDASLPITYRIGGVDRNYFNINSRSGVITFKVAPDFEMKNIYSLSVRATDSSLARNTGTQDITINIIDVFEVPDVTAPVFSSVATQSVSENSIIAFQLEADDNATITYSIDMNDSADFNVDAQSGKITFIVAPDYESGRITYAFVAKATDLSANEVTQNITINITDILDDELSYDGLDYLKVLSPYTGKIWLDRNLGATQACSAYNDSACFGDYFQWGRGMDGHEKTTSPTTTTQAVSVDTAGGSFILSDANSSQDWAKAVDENATARLINWAKTDGSYICPVGFRVPTIIELKDDTFNHLTVEAQYRVRSNIDAYNSFLRLPTAGSRSGTTGAVSIQSSGYVWGNDISTTRASVVLYTANNSHIGNYNRARGNSIRCIED